MPCYSPLSAWRTDDGEIIFKERGHIRDNITLPCGQCIGCRLEKSRQWAVRCMHEARMHKRNTFLTLTYDDDHLPDRYWTGARYTTGRNAGNKIYAGNLRYPDVQKFFKRLRKAIAQKSAFKGGDIQPASPKSAPTAQNTDMGLTPHTPIRYYLAGEYGEQHWRPHWHICLFGYDFQDAFYLQTSKTGHKLFMSPTLAQLWPYGLHSIGELNFETAAYTARYVMKKITGQQAKQHYQKLDYDTGEIINLKPEFNVMSRRQGIGLSWLNRFRNDVYPHGYVVVRNHKTQPPRYYDKKWSESLEGGNYLDNDDPYEILRLRRHLAAALHYEDQTDSRLLTRRRVTEAQVKQLKRTL